MKKCLATIFGFALTLLALSCSTKKTDTDVLRMNICSEPDNFFFWKSSAADTKAILYNICEGLVTFDKDGKIIPCLAENFVISEDGLGYIFTLRNDVYFHNGKKLTSEDVIYTYENLAGLNGNTPKSDEMQIVKKITEIAPNTLLVQLKNPSASFLSFAIQPILQAGYDDNENHPVGTGPYKFVEYSIHQKVVLEKNENYWNKKRMPKINRIELFVISDEAAAISALQSGQLDIAQMINASNAKALKSQFDMITYPQNMVQIFAMNNAVKPFDDFKVRKAICLAVNKDEIIEGAMDGAATKLYSNFSPVLGFYYNDKLEKINEYDIKKAKDLLKEAGYENGFEFTVKVPSNYTVHVDTATIIQAQLAKIGVKMNIETIEWTTWLSDVYTNRQYEATVIAFGGKLEPNDILKRYTTTYKKNFVNFSDEQFDKDFTEALTETDDTKRADLYKNCQKILSEKCPCAFICDPNNTLLKKKNIKGFTYYPISYYDFASLSY